MEMKSILSAVQWRDVAAYTCDTENAVVRQLIPFAVLLLGDRILGIVFCVCGWDANAMRIGTTPRS
jgi:hypothetical protein